MVYNKKKFLITALSLLPFLLLFFMYLFFLRIDSKYSLAINDELENVTFIHKLSAESVNSYFELHTVLITNDKNERVELESAWFKNSNRMTSYVDSLSKIYLVKWLTKETVDYIVNARQAYLDKCKKFVEFVNSEYQKDAEKFFKEEVEKSFFEYQNYITNFVAIHKAEVTAYNNSLSREIKIFDLNDTFLGIPIIYHLSVLYVVCALSFLFYMYKRLVGKKKKAE